MLLQYVVFVFEERPRLVWDPTAQSELFRFVFNPAQVAAAYRLAFDRIASEDSARRNVRVQVNKLRNQLTVARAAAAIDRETRAQIELRHVELEAIDTTIRSLSNSIERIDEERRRVREALVQDQHRHEDAHREYARIEQQYLQSVFPTAAETARLVFARSDTGCLICGDRSDAALRRIQSQVDRRRCPLCDSPAPPAEPGIVPLATVEQARLRRAGDEAEARRREIRDRERRLDNLAIELREASGTLGGATRRRRELERELDAFEARLPPDTATVTRMGDQLETLEDQLKRHEVNQRDAEDDLELLVDETRHRVELVRDSLRDRFQTYASAFLEETCELVYEASERRVGQEGQLFRFPRFHVRMTTALSHDEGRPRMSDGQVSESQKEFIDLAFRMALVSSLIGPDDAAMMVLETPESSLDQVFAARAGRLLGLFAREGGTPGNRLIASSNVTDGPMIAALLGAVDERLSTNGAETQPHYVPPDDRPRHVLDLLTIAAETAAVRKYRTEYTAALRRAMYPEGGGAAAKGLHDRRNLRGRSRRARFSDRRGRCIAKGRTA